MTTPRQIQKTLIRQAAVADASDILALQRHAYQSEAALYPGEVIPPLTQTLDEITAEFADHVFLAACLDNRIVGSVRILLREGTGYVGRLIVHPDCQNRGIGKQLLREVERTFPSAARFELFTGYKSERNLYLYNKLGYREFRRQRVSDILTLVYMEKIMSNPDKSTVQTGLKAIEETFARSKAEGRATFMPFFTIGFPDLPTSLTAIEALVEAGADAIEVGMPFSDPLADGPTIQHASQVSLANHTRIQDCIDAVRTLRERGVTVPLIMMGYINPLLNYGLERFVRNAVEAGASGFIIPDLPPEEADEMITYTIATDTAQIPLLAPNSTPERIKQIVALARGFVYLVSVTGVTGARDTLPPDLADYVRRVRGFTSLPLAVGFGISKPAHARMVAGLADGVIVASALIRLTELEGLDAMRTLASSLRAACVREKLH